LAYFKEVSHEHKAPVVRIISEMEYRGIGIPCVGTWEPW